MFHVEGTHMSKTGSLSLLRPSGCGILNWVNVYPVYRFKLGSNIGFWRTNNKKPVLPQVQPTSSHPTFSGIKLIFYPQYNVCLSFSWLSYVEKKVMVERHANVTSRGDSRKSLRKTQRRKYGISTGRLSQNLYF